MEKLLFIISTLVSINLFADPVCREGGYSEFSQIEIRDLQLAASAIKCGQPAVAREYLAVAQRLLARDIGPIAVTPRGSCFEEKNCKGANVGSALTVDKGTCDALGGKSWREETPTPGKCENFKP
jgi:hypothetical protein